MAAGSLTIVGLGPARVEQVTVEAVEALREGAANGAVAYGLAHARELAGQIVPELPIKSLDAYYGRDLDRSSDVYNEIAQMLLRRAFGESTDVLYLVPGNPYVLNDAVFILRQVCRERDLPLGIIHGLSFLDLVLDGVHWTGHNGLQLFSAWNIVRDRISLAVNIPALLSQLGEWSSGTEAIDTSGSTAMLADLRTRLLEQYPLQHPVFILYSSGSPEYSSFVHSTTINRLPEQLVPVYANLWIPALDENQIELERTPGLRLKNLSSASTARGMISLDPVPGSQLDLDQIVDGSRHTAGLQINTAKDNIVEGHITVSSTLTRPVEMLAVLRPLVDAAIESTLDRADAARQPVTCHEGCSACCHRLVTVSDVEARGLAELIQQLPEQGRIRLQERFSATRQAVEQAGLMESLSAVGSLDSAARSQLDHRYFQQHMSCPFLQNERCSIYAERPYICREHMVKSPPNRCWGTDVDRVLPDWSAANAVRAWSDTESQELPLILALEWVDSHPETAPERTGIELLEAITNQQGGLGLSIAADGKKSQRAASVPAQPVQITVEPLSHRFLVPEYERPDALMVVHGDEEDGVLSDIVLAASQHIGIILLSSNPQDTHAFVNAQPDPQRFTIVTAMLDTPWLRDRAPFAVRTDEDCEWILPKMPEDDRPADAIVFEKISAKQLSYCPRYISGGNLIAGPGGLALSSTRIFLENTGNNPDALRGTAKVLGIHQWIFLPPFSQEMTGHADIQVRFLAADLYVVAWSLTSDVDRAVAAGIEDVLREVLPNARGLRLPMRSEGSRYASPLNWIQIDDELLVPRYSMVPEDDIEEIERILTANGYRVQFLDSPTEAYGGSLHCLSASIYAQGTGEGLTDNNKRTQAETK